MTRVTVENVWKVYGDQTVLENINLEIEPGSFIALVGPSGCGKSTFLRMMLGDEAPSRGRILLDGEELDAEPSPDRGVVFQKYSVFPHLTALQNVMMGVQVHGEVADSVAQSAAAHMLGLVGLSDRTTYLPANLSGGQKQRVAVARALVSSPALVLADEPTAALDKESAADVVDLLKRMAAARGTTTLLVTHDNRILDRADRILTLEDGRIVKTEDRASNQDP